VDKDSEGLSFGAKEEKVNHDLMKWSCATKDVYKHSHN